MIETRVIVGSGPCAVAATHALLERGFEVIMLDAGETLDQGKSNIVARMASQEPEQWVDADKAVIQRVGFDSGDAVSPKRVFGSDYAYFVDPKVDAPSAMRLYGSRAFGGLSVVWGCALIKAASAELSGWPTEVSDAVVKCYPQIRDLIKMSIGADILAEGTHLRISAAAKAVWDRHRRSQTSHKDIDVYPTPLAIATECKACNACMYGCVYRYSYSSRITVEDIFARNPLFRYVGGVIVESFEERSGGVEVRGTNTQDGSQYVLFGRQLFLAAGMIASLRILWKSSRVISRELVASDSALFLIPGLCFSGDWGTDKHHGLAHLSVDLQSPPFETKPVHIQLYFNNPAVADGLEQRVSPFRTRPLRKLINLANRIVVAGQGYLHSDYCHQLKLRCDNDGRIHASVVHNPDTDNYIDTALSHFTKKMRKFGLYFPKGAASVTRYGGSKTAGALPHALEAGPSTTDLLGRPFQSDNVFVVDTTVMPSMLARNVTLTAMANALRIGQAA